MRSGMAAGVAPLEASTARQILTRALRLECPRCGRTSLYAAPFTMHERCAACGLRYEQEHGYFVGAIYVNYAVTIAIAIGVVLGLDWSVGLSLRAQLAIGIALVTIVPLVFFRHARSLWLGIDYLVTRADRRQERRRSLPR